MKRQLVLLAAAAGIAALLTAHSNPISNQPATTHTWAVEEKNDSLNIRFSSTNAHYNYLTNEGVLYLYTEFKAPLFRGADSTQRTPLNLSLVIDRSGSMDGAKLEYAKKAAMFVVDHVTPDDYLSIVIYDSEVKTLFPSQRVTNKVTLKNLIQQLRSGSSTNLSGGMLEGYNQVQTTYKSGYVNRVLLMSDGLANEGITDNLSLFNIVRGKLREQGVSISTFGVGLDYNEDLMQGLAENGNGNYYFIANPEEIPSIFKKELNGLLYLYAQNTSIHITLPEGVKFSRLYGLTAERADDREVVINLRDVFSEETKACVLKLTYTAALQAPLNFSAKFSWNNMSRNAENTTALKSITLTQKTDTAELAKTENEQVWQQVYLFESNDLLQQTIQAVDKRKFDEAQKIAVQNEAYFAKAKQKVRFNSELAKQDSINVNYSKSIEKSKTMLDSELKYYQKINKSGNYNIKSKK